MPVACPRTNIAPPPLSASLPLKQPLTITLFTSPLMYNAPPLNALLLINVELIIESEKEFSIYTAPPDLLAVLLSNIEPNKFILFIANIAPPLDALLLIKIQLDTVPELLK